jgi:archaellum component FlaC
LAAVQNQVARVDHELDIQMKRMAQIQVELDELRDRVKRLQESLK